AAAPIVEIGAGGRIGTPLAAPAAVELVDNRIRSPGALEHLRDPVRVRRDVEAVRVPGGVLLPPEVARGVVAHPVHVRAAGRGQFPLAPRGAPRPRRLHRRLVQPRTAALDARVSEPHAVRTAAPSEGASRVNRPSVKAGQVHSVPEPPSYVMGALRTKSADRTWYTAIIVNTFWRTRAPSESAEPLPTITGSPVPEPPR